MPAYYVIAITRTCGSGAMAVSKLLAEDLGLDIYDKNLLRLAADDSGINEAVFAQADEDMKKSLLFKVSQKIYNGELIPPESNDYTSNQNLFNFQAKVLKELTERESFICIGRAADYVLKDYPRLLRIFLYAPLEDRVLRERKRLGLELGEAVRYVQKTDQYREEYYTYHTGSTWKNPQNYDLCMDTGSLGYIKCAKIIKSWLCLKKWIASDKL